MPLLHNYAMNHTELEKTYISKRKHNKATYIRIKIDIKDIYLYYLQSDFRPNDIILWLV